MRRNPFFKGGSQGIIVNNYIYNPGSATIHYNLSPQEWEGHEWVTGKMTVEENVIEFGESTRKTAVAGNFRGPVDVYWANNKVISEQVRNKTSRIIDSEKEVGGYPNIKPVYRKFKTEEWDLKSMKRK